MANCKRLLVTGGAGFIGANFVRYWLTHYTDDIIVVLDALTYAGNYENLRLLEQNPNFIFVHGNINDTVLVERLLRSHAINTLVHFAAESHVDRSIAAPDAFIETNILGTYSLLKAAKTVWLDGKTVVTHRFHHISTDEVYGDLTVDEPAFTEASPYAPNSPYAASKAASDHLVHAYHKTFGLQVSTSFSSNNYGPFQFPEKLIPLVITNILNNKPLPIYGDGLQVRDWVYVKDHVRGVAEILQKGGVGENYNIGGQNEWANIYIVKCICALVGKEFLLDPTLKSLYPKALAAAGNNAENLIVHVADRLGHDRRYAIDATKIATKLGSKPRELFESSLRKTVQWYLRHPEWWAAQT